MARPGESHRRWRRESDATIRCDRFGDEASNEQDGGVVVSLPEIWNRFAAKGADFAVGENRFEAITDFESILVIVNGEQDQDAAIGFGPDAQLRRKVDGIVLDGLVSQRLDGDDGDLCLGLLLNLGAKSGDLRFR